MDNTFSLNGTPPQNPITDTNPLNTGNGSVANTTNPQVQTVNSSEPHEIKLETLTPGSPVVNTSPVTPAAPFNSIEPTPIASQPIPSTETGYMPNTPALQEISRQPETPEPQSKTKLYIIIAVVTVLAITLGYFGYSYFAGNSNNETEEANAKNPEQSINLTNKLSDTEKSEISDEMKELDSVVGDLKDIYSEKEDSSNPPSLSIDLSGESTSSESETPAETGETITEETPSTEEKPKKVTR